MVWFSLILVLVSEPQMDDVWLGIDLNDLVGDLSVWEVYGSIAFSLLRNTCSQHRKVEW